MRKEANIILDCDTGEDDALAILLAVNLKRPLHYVVTSYGNSTIENSTRNTSRILSLADASEIRVIRGSSQSLEQHKHKPEGESAGDFVGKNGLCNVELPPSRFDNVISPVESELPDILSGLLRREVSVDYIVTGPCTNLARVCLNMGDEIYRYVRSVYMMGGAIDEFGNSGPQDENGHQVAEFNFYCDPKAADIVLKSGLPINLVTWDITSKLTVPYHQIETFHPQTDTSQFVVTLMKSFFAFYGLANDRNFELNDPVTVWAQMGNGERRTRRISVQTGFEDYGRSFEDPNGSGINYIGIKEEDRSMIINSILRGLVLNNRTI